MAFPPSFLDELRGRVALSAIVGRRLKLVRAGREHKACCPFHAEKTPSFTVNDAKGFYHCFGCGAHGDVIGFVMRHDHLDFVEAVELLAAEAGLAVPRPSADDRKRAARDQQLHEALEAAAAWFEARLAAADGAEARAYLDRRGVEAGAIASFRLGYAPADGGALRRHLLGAGFGEADLIEAGLLRKPERARAAYAFFRDRVIFPVTDRRGRVIGFGGRLLAGDGPKYINSPDSPLFQKGRMLYGLARARTAVADGAPVVLVEGYMDVIALVGAGFAGAVAPLGTAVTEHQLDALWRLGAGEAAPVLCFDGDAAGRRAATRAAERVLPLVAPDRTVTFAFLPEGEDPDSLVRGQGVAAMRAVLEAARPLVDLVWELASAGRPLDTPEARAGLEAAVEARCREIADRSVQAHYRRALRERVYALFAPQRRARTPLPPRAGRPGPPRPDSWRAMGLAEPGEPWPHRRTRPPSRQQIRDCLITAAIITHPRLVEEFEEQLAAATLAPPLDALVAAVLDLVAADPDVDAEALVPALAARGFADEIARVTDRAAALGVRCLVPPTANGDEARQWLAGVFTAEGEAQVRAEFTATARALQQDTPSSDLLARYDALSQALDQPGEDDG